MNKLYFEFLEYTELNSNYYSTKSFFFFFYSYPLILLMIIFRIMPAIPYKLLFSFKMHFYKTDLVN